MHREKLCPSTALPNAPVCLVTPTYDGSGQITQPDILYFPNSFNNYKYYMATTPFPNNDGAAENPTILVSNDGLTWYNPEPNPNPLLPPPVNRHLYCDPDMIYNNGELWMYYHEEGGSDGDFSWIKLLKSSNGTVWTSVANPVINIPYRYGALGLTVVKKDDTHFYMWSSNTHNDGYCGLNNRVEYRTSSDGLNWTYVSDQTAQVVPDGYQPWHLDVEYIPEKSEYWMLLAAYPSATPDSNYCKLFFAKSTDGINWSKYSRPVLECSSDVNAWDSGCVYRSGFIYDASTDKIRVWYGARNRSLIWHVGYTEDTYTSFMNALTK